MSSSAPCATPTATLAMASAISAGDRDADERDVDAGRIDQRHQRPLRRHERRVDVEVVAARPAEAGDRPGVLDHDLVRGEDGDAHLRHAVHDALDAVAVDPVRVLAAAGEAPAAGHAVAAVLGGDRAGRAEDAGRDGVRRRRTARRRWRAAARPGRTTCPTRSAPSRPPTRRPRRTPRTRAWRRGGRPRGRRGCGAAARGRRPRRSARRAGRRAPGGRPRSPPARAAIAGAIRRPPSRTSVGVAMSVRSVVNAPHLPMSCRLRRAWPGAAGARVGRTAQPARPGAWVIRPSRALRRARARRRTPSPRRATRRGACRRGC